VLLYPGYPLQDLEGAYAVAGTRKRVVTGVNAEGKSIVTSAGPPPTIFQYDTWSMTEEWAIDSFPPPLDEQVNPADAGGDYQLQPPVGGARCRIVTFGPHSSFPMHVTATLDFVVVISGRLRLIMEEGEVTLEPGDSVVQRGTIHGWANDGDVDCVVAGILINDGSATG